MWPNLALDTDRQVVDTSEAARLAFIALVSCERNIWLYKEHVLEVLLCVFIPSILGTILLVGAASAGVAQKREAIFPPHTFCGACLVVDREKDFIFGSPYSMSRRLSCRIQFFTNNNNEIFALHTP